MDKNRKKQLDMISVAQKQIMQWAKRERLSLSNVDYVVPFVEDDFSLTTWFFYETNAQIDVHEKNGDSERLKHEFLRVLSSLGYPSEWLSSVDFAFDSDENVKKNFAGSYFYRLR